MLRHQLLIEVVVRRTVHDDMQTFLQSEVGESARKAHKHKRGAVRDVMLQMREIAGDCPPIRRRPSGRPSRRKARQVRPPRCRTTSTSCRTTTASFPTATSRCAQ